MTTNTKKDDDIPNEPFVLTNLLSICRQGLESISMKLYDIGGEEQEGIAEVVEDAAASVEVARNMCKRRSL